jgi:DNA-binding response OmpR family regulator
MAADILLLDDDVIQGATRKAILDQAGYRTILVTEGQRALDALQSPEGYDVRLVVTDHSMPVMNGPQFVRAARKNGYTFPILVLSGYPDIEEQYDSLDVAIRVKPFPPEQFIAFVRYLVDSCNLRSA